MHTPSPTMISHGQLVELTGRSPRWISTQAKLGNIPGTSAGTPRYKHTLPVQDSPELQAWIGRIRDRDRRAALRRQTGQTTHKAIKKGHLCAIRTGVDAVVGTVWKMRSAGSLRRFPTQELLRIRSLLGEVVTEHDVFSKMIDDEGIGRAATKKAV